MKDYKRRLVVQISSFESDQLDHFLEKYDYMNISDVVRLSMCQFIYQHSNMPEKSFDKVLEGIVSKKLKEILV